MSLRIGLFVLGMACCALANAQEQRVVNGRKFTVHLVTAGQTLYAIAQTHAVPVDILLATNPAAADGLSIGEEVLIPQDAVVKKERKTAPALRADGELVHTVHKRETLFGIARRYGVEMNVLLERNPDALNLKEGMELVIPVARIANLPAATTSPAMPGEGATHLVQPGETLFSLGQRYAVDPERIREANGGLPDGLKAGASITIPGVAKATPPEPVVRTKEHMRYKVAMLLPFAIERNDSVLANAQEGEPVAFYEPTRIAAQFHNGARMAMDSLQRMGLYADVDVLDLGDDLKTWNTVLKRPAMQEYDLFIGPFHRTAIELLARTAPRAHIVCPVPQSNKVILGMPMVSKVTPTRSDLVKHAARYVATHYAKENILLARPEIAAEKDAQEQVRQALNATLATQSDRLRDSVLCAKPGKRDIGDLVSKLDAARLNVILAPSDDVEFVTTLVSKLKQQSTKYRIRLVGMESWNDMASVATSDLEVLDFTYAAPSFFDAEDPRIKAFTSAYRERFKTDVDGYALLGFDVTFYYLTALLEQGTGFADHFTKVRTEPLHMGFRMSRTGEENGFRNEYAIMLEQEDLRLIKVK